MAPTSTPPPAGYHLRPDLPAAAPLPLRLLSQCDNPSVPRVGKAQLDSHTTSGPEPCPLPWAPVPRPLRDLPASYWAGQHHPLLCKALGQWCLQDSPPRLHQSPFRPGCLVRASRQGSLLKGSLAQLGDKATLPATGPPPPGGSPSTPSPQGPGPRDMWLRRPEEVVPHRAPSNAPRPPPQPARESQTTDTGFCSSNNLFDQTNLPLQLSGAPGSRLRGRATDLKTPPHPRPPTLVHSGRGSPTPGDGGGGWAPGRQWGEAMPL